MPFLALSATPAEIKRMAEEKLAGSKYKDQILATIKWESEYKNIQSTIPNPKGPNGREDSWGIVQIHLPSHPEITKDQALDPVFAIDFIISEFSKGRASKWTGWRKQFGDLKKT